MLQRQKYKVGWQRLFLALSLALAPLSGLRAIELMTYNLGLAKGFVDHYEERRIPIATEIKKSHADIICLQEVWFAQDRENILQELKSDYPYSLVPDIDEVTNDHAPACRLSDLFGENKIVTCFRSACEKLTGRELTACVIDKCQASLNNLKNDNPQCGNALMAQVGTHPLLVILKLLMPFGKVDLYTYGGSNGLMLFSKFPFKQGGSGLLPLRQYSTLTRRDFLYATIQASDDKQLFVGCTHLTANLTDSAPYAGAFESWGKENLKQVEYLLPQFETLAAGLPMAIMGDFNFGPSYTHSNIQANFEDSYQSFKQKGYMDPIAMAGVPQCTFCNNNNLNLASDNNQQIDHIFIKNLDHKKVKEAQVIMNHKVQIPGASKMLDTYLSDHYGLKLEISL